MKGICFIPPLFKATVAGLKIQTRRIMDTQPDDSGLHDQTNFPLSVDSKLTGFWGTVNETGEDKEFKPRYKTGETVYLKEPYDYLSLNNQELVVAYQFLKEWTTEEIEDLFIKWRNKLFMPAAAARYFIEITAARPERLQDISDEDCMKEGIQPYKVHKGNVMYNNGYDLFLYPRDAYQDLINRINGKGTWDSNPWVWVYDYKLTDKPEKS